MIVAKYLMYQESDLREKNILDIGCGTGALGIILGTLGIKIKISLS